MVMAGMSRGAPVLQEQEDDDDEMTNRFASVSPLL